MKVRLSALALCALLLAGCRQVEEGSASLPPEPVPQTAQELLEGQTIDDTHDAFLVDTGGRLGTLLVTVEQYQFKGNRNKIREQSVVKALDLLRRCVLENCGKEK